MEDYQYELKPKNVNISKGVAIADEELNLIVTKENFRRFVGLQLTHACLFDIIGKPYADSLRKNLKKVDDGKSISFLIKMRRSDGEMRDVSIRVSLSHDKTVKDGKYTIELIDIANIHSYVYDMELKGVKYKNILDSMGEMFFEYDSLTDVFSIFSLTCSCEEIVGRVKLSEIIVNNDELCDEEDITKFALFCRSLRQGDPFINFSFKRIPFVKNEDNEPITLRGRSFNLSENRVLTVGCIYKTDASVGPVGTDAESLDMMTGLLNKTAVIDIAKSAISEKKYNQVFLIMIDLDSFKFINDTYGHMFGDEVIKKVALILKSNIKQNGWIGRFGGDEFFAVLYNIGSEGDLRTIVSSIANDVRNSFKDKLDGFTLSCSIGISEYPRNGSDFDLLFKKADKGVYIAKSKGKNRFIIYKEEMHGEIDLKNPDEDYAKKLDTAKFLGDIKRYSIMRDGICALAQNGIKSIDLFMKNIIDAYALAGISLYSGDGFKLTKQWGKYSSPMPDADYMLSKRAIARFNDKNMFRENNIRFNNSYLPIVHDKLLKHSIEATVQCMIKDGDNILGVMTFDIETSMRKWEEEDVNHFGIVSQLVGDMLLKAHK